MSKSLSIFRSVCAGAAALLMTSFVANAQDNFPNGAISIIVPYSAGSAPDLLARLSAEQMQTQLGSPVIVENRPGSNGNVAVSTLANSRPDGHALLLLEGSMLSINPHLYRNLSYGKDDFIPVSLLGVAPIFLTVNSNVPVSNFEEFLEYAKNTDKLLNYGSSGVGTPHHLTTEELARVYDLKMRHVPYRGSSESRAALLSGELDVLFASYASIAEFAKEGRVKMLAVNSIERTAEAPEIPAIAEFIPDFDLASRMGLVAYKGTPTDRIEKIAAEATKAMKTPAVAERLATAGVVAVGSTPEEYGEIIDDEIQRVGEVIKAAGIKPE